MEPLEDTYTNATVILRPARVAVLFRGGDHWRSSARLAISVTGKYWGGAGFILVPFKDDGTVAPEIIDVVAAYDPDHVVTVRLPRREMERVNPGFIALRSEDGKLLVEAEERRSYLTRPDVIDLPIQDSVALKARAFVAAACTPFRYGDPGEVQSESIEHLDFEVGPRPGRLIAAARPMPSESVVLAGSETWTGSGSLSLAIRTGVLPYALEKDQNEREEPDEAQMMRLALDPERWSRKAPGDLVERMNVGGASTGEKTFFWCDEPDGGLTSLRYRFSIDAGAVVVGDTAEDFALAYAYERLLGFGVWLSSEMLTNETVARTIRLELANAGMRVQGWAGRLLLSSSSLDRAELTGLTEVLCGDSWEANPFPDASTDAIGRSKSLPDGVELGVPELRLGLHQMAVAEPPETQLSVPVSVAQDGTTFMRAPLATPQPAALIRPKNGPVRPYWYVGVNFWETSMPHGRGVPQIFVQPERQPFINSGVRSSRDGFVFHSQAGGLIGAGASLTSQISQPRLKILGMQPWVQAMANQAGLEAKSSVPGMHAQLLARRLGGRQALAEMVSGPFHPALRRFASGDPKKPAERTSKVFPLRDGVALGYDPYPRFEALCRCVPGLRDEDVRSWIDQLAQADLLRRGFILDCSDCTRPSFVGIDQIGQRFLCVRCSAVNELTATRWNNDGNEPAWFYDLHASFRELMTTHGDVGLFAAQHLRRGTWEYSDTSEIEFLAAGTGKPVAEMDLIAHVNGEVVVVEAKSNGKLGNGPREARSAAKKKIDIALALHADKVLLATTRPRMANSAKQMLREAATLAGARNLRIDEITGLGPELFETEPTFDI
ncbi:hypothetical protein GCM10007170_37560 [Arthrobacter liuii]|uniref:Uncharacterized protein n=1 Tax=Arthrobacter liuii TaxID=1476996 RepID=A0ABQ2AZS5_9MICC|nr:hypothetical protein [Arthrobacter liuii]GGI00432.1 hypothetical protein GCM10007170_37560 [Arthrobacter liuii]